MNITFWKEQILLSNGNLLFHSSCWKNNQSTMSKIKSLSRPRFPDVTLSTVPGPSLYAAASFQPTMVGFHHFLPCSHNCKAFHQYPLPGFCSRKQFLLSWLTLQITSLFWLLWAVVPLQNDGDQPRQEWGRAHSTIPGSWPATLWAAESPGSSSLFHNTRVYSFSSTLSLWCITTVLYWIARALSLITIGQLIKI